MLPSNRDHRVKASENLVRWSISQDSLRAGVVSVIASGCWKTHALEGHRNFIAL